MSKLIAVDIGHGTNTSGKRVIVGGKTYLEHTFNSAVGVELDKLLRHNGFRTLLLQKPNSPEYGLMARIAEYNRRKVDLVWSIHADANSNSMAQGRYAFYWHTAADSRRLAQLYAEEVNRAGYSTRGDGTQASRPGEWTNLAICRETNMTAVLTENGFMTNPADFKLIFESRKYVEDMARVHARAICRYYGIAFKDIGGSKADVAPASNPNTSKKEAEKLDEIKKINQRLDKIEKLLEFDAKKPSDWAADDWKEACENGYLDGSDPRRFVRREELAKVVNTIRRNFLPLIKGKNKAE